MKKIKLLTPIMCAATVLPVVASLASCTTGEIKISEPEAKASVIDFKDHTRKFSQYCNYSVILGEDYNVDDIKITLEGDDAKYLAVADKKITNDRILTFSVGIIQPTETDYVFKFDVKFTINGKEKVSKGYTIDFKQSPGYREDQGSGVSWDGNPLIKNVVIAASERSSVINPNGFRGVKSITNVTLPTGTQGTKTIGANAFQDCSVQNINISEVNTFGKNAFNGTKIKELNFAGTDNVALDLGGIGSMSDSYSGTFANNPNLTKVVFAENPSAELITSCGAYTFANNPNLETVDLGNRFEKLGFGMFQNCPKLETIDLGNHIFELGSRYLGRSTATNSVFLGCTSLKKIIFGQACTIAQLCGYTFYNLPSLEEIDLPYDTDTGLTTLYSWVGNYDFANCTNLKKINHLDFSNLTTFVYGLGSHTFENCENLEIPHLNNTGCGYGSIGAFCFANCKKLSKLTVTSTFDGNRRYWQEGAFKGSGLEEIVFKENEDTSQRTDGVYASNTEENGVFENCTKLSKIDVSEIGDTTRFMGEYNGNWDAHNNMFKNISPTGTLTVKAAYAENWKNFFSNFVTFDADHWVVNEVA